MSTYQQERFPFPSPGRLRRELRLPRPPLWLALSMLALAVPAAIALGLVYYGRHTTSPRPRIQILQDMGVQPRYGPQASSPVFADGRSARLPVAGTIAQGQLQDRSHLHHGWQLETDPATGQSTLMYFRGLPPELPGGAALVARGQRQFTIYCAPCHGPAADGRSIMNDIALQNLESKWIPAPSLLSPAIRDMPEGQIYNTIRNGIRNMPPHGSQIDTPDRWAIVAYLREQQRQAPATADLQSINAPPTRR